MEAQMDRIRIAIQSDPLLRHGFNFYGESQGALQARAYVSLINDPPVFNLVGISGPQAGVGLCPEVESPTLKRICAAGAPLLGIYHWPRCAFCGYWKGTREDEYLRNSQWLARVNNDGPEKQ